MRNKSILFMIITALCVFANTACGRLANDTPLPNANSNASINQNTNANANSNTNSNQWQQQ